ncbi:hypothetical protein H310_04951 [Aphanomyces invadans]|uniref:Uncharacterized protein n=1 Tax=Aphanomyces invadans TaxID=157072 RepID=A0A024UAS4_9STRA|nr:hypothetical protein H310_04951 [Aphanomyces invadans]ETW03506.1 hypothetical protein H310_04951 [Aphanomyces invadans]|eukprot:XP_008867735.1 hypothetical protein H310_04951 [Aphanomyces invadans]
MKRLRVMTQLVPTPRDDESADTQEISVVDFADILLRICNEQFGELGRLGQRVDRFVVEHLCFLQQAKSALREEAQSAAMKSVLSEFKEQLAGIFKRYAVKPKSKEKGVLHFKLRDWMAFVKDFKLLSPRFTYEAAHDLFRNVQEGASHEDDMEMVYAEFCEAVVALAGFQIPDPFMDWPVKASTFIHRYLNHDVSKE